VTGVTWGKCRTLWNPWQGGWAPSAQKRRSIANGNTVNPALPESLTSREGGPVDP